MHIRIHLTVGIANLLKKCIQCGGVGTVASMQFRIW